MALSIVILAAGAGKRMCSKLPKVLHRLAGKTLLEHCIETAGCLDARQPVIVYGFQGELVRHTLGHLNVTWVEQKEQLGTGHALRQALPQIPEKDRVLVLYGDVPLISTKTLNAFIAQTPENALGMITANLPDPTGFGGRILRDSQQKIVRVVEEKDADKTQLAIPEINSGFYLVPATYLSRWLSNLRNDNAQREYYLTDIITLAAAENIPIHSMQPHQYEEILGINDKIQLARLERFYQQKQAEKFMRQGVTLLDPDRFDVRGDLSIGHDVTIDINFIAEGRVKIGNNCTIGSHVILRNTVIGDNVEIKPNSVIDGAEIAADCIIGPFARIRPGTVLAPHVHIGNFAEIKNSFIGEGTKIHHVSYTGDSETGRQVNIGAGTIMCNYDGVNKHKTIIGDNAFIGSNSSLVAPVTIGEGAVIGAGSTITQDAPPQQLTLARARQCTVENWQRNKKKEKES